MPKAPSDKLLATAGLFVLAALLLVEATCARDSNAPGQEPNPPIEEVLPPTDKTPASTKTPQTLALGDQVEEELAPGESSLYSIQAAEGEYLHVLVDQHGVDVTATLFDPGGGELLVMDRTIGATGAEPLIAILPTAGIYTVRIEAASGDRPVGSCSIWIEQLRRAKTVDVSRAAATATFADAKSLYGKGEYSRAAERYEEAEAAWRRLGERDWEAESLVRRGLAQARLGEYEAAADQSERAANLFRETGNARWEAFALHWVGLARFRLQDLDQAIASFQQALPLRQAAGDLRGEAMTHHQLAHVFQRQDEIQLALDSYAQALKLFQRPGDRAYTNQNLGVLYLSLGRMDQARDALEEAEKAWAELGDRRQAGALNQLGEVHRALHSLDSALDYYHRALVLRRELEDKRGEVTSLANIGRAYQALDEFPRALEHYLKAQEFLADLDDPRLEARVLLNLASLYLEMDQALKAQQGCVRSLDLYRSVGDPTGEAEALLGIARAERRLGNLAGAHEASTHALSIFESVRPRAISPELRTSYFATVQDHFEFHVDVLMELHLLEPSAGHDAQALVVSERSRARSLLDLLAEAGAKIRRDAEPAILEREKDLQSRLNVRERVRHELRQSSTTRPSELTSAEKAVRLAVQELEEVRAEIRIRHPRYAALTQPLSVPEIQRQILGDDTLLLEYKLGEKRSFVWAVTPISLQSFELRGREEIELVARRTYTLLTNSHRRETRESTRNALCQLGQNLLQPVAPLLAGKRLLIVGDGALQLIPFAALPEPGPPGQCHQAPPLVVEHEITYLPSASALAILRRESDGRPSSPRLLAVVADPVFDPTDPRLRAPQAARVGSGNPPPTSSRYGYKIGQRSFDRLPFSRQEANGILALVDEKDRLQALDFDANKGAIVDGSLYGHRVIHFATHGVLDTVHPELSAIVLSQVDREGRAQDGFLRAHEIYNLQLPCDLVVLSACQTALGKVVRGEGLLSLTRGFMYAGAARVMVSLWNVDDASTAELMKEFYGGIFEQQLRPAAALRAAQIAKWRDAANVPYYHWAGFVIQGEWRE